MTSPAVRQQSAPAILRSISHPEPELRILNDHANPPGEKVKHTSQTTAQTIQELEDIMKRMCSICTCTTTPGVDYTALRHHSVYPEYQAYVNKIRTVDLTNLTDNQKIAFYINIYNALTIDGLLEQSTLPESILNIRMFWKITCYNIGGHVFSLNDIFHGLLRGNRPCPGSKKLPFAPDDPRLPLCVQKMDPRIHFALVSGAKCSPPLFVYNSLDLFGQLNSVVRVACLEAIRVYEVRREIHVSTLFQWYRKDFGKNDLEAIRWTSPYLAAEKAKTLAFMIHTMETQGMVDLMYEEFDFNLNNIDLARIAAQNGSHNVDPHTKRLQPLGFENRDQNAPLLNKQTTC